MSTHEPSTNAGPRPDPVSPSPGEVAEQILRDSSYQALRGLTCSFRDGVLTISGRLPSYYLTQIVMTEMRGIEGVDRIENRIEVVS